MQAVGNQIRVARVLHEDDAFLTLEVVKDDQRPMRLEDGDQFYTMLFVHAGDQPDELAVWLPWEQS